MHHTKTLYRFTALQTRNHIAGLPLYCFTVQELLCLIPAFPLYSLGILLLWEDY